MGIRFTCHECGKKLNVKTFLAGKRGICPACNARFLIPTESGGKAEPVVKSTSPPLAGGGLNPAMNLSGASVSAAPQGSLTTPITGGPISRPATTVMSPVAPASAPASDPLTQSPNSVWYVRPSSGGQFGPALGDVMRQWIDEGRVSADSLVWREGWEQWQSASALFPQMGSPQMGIAQSSSPAPLAAPSAVAPTAPISRPVAASVAAAAVAPVLGPISQASTGSTFTPVKKSNGMTALMVVILVLVAIFLMVVFAYILYRQGGDEEYNEARLSGRPAQIAQAYDQEALQGL